MIQLTIQNPHSKTEILSSIEDIKRKTHSFFESLSPELFFHNGLGGWSAAQNLSHLNTITSLSVELLKLPRFFLIPFGKRKNQKDFITLKDEYINSKKAIQIGPLAPSSIEPPKISNELIEKMLREWDSICGNLKAVLENVPEEDFDKYSIPHPSLGILSYREILYVIIFHAIHHTYKVEQKIEKAGLTISR